MQVRSYVRETVKVRSRLGTMKTVGTRVRAEFEIDPVKAWQRGLALDAMLRVAMPLRPRGVCRLTHVQMNQVDLERQLEQAGKVNRPRNQPGSTDLSRA